VNQEQEPCRRRAIIAMRNEKEQRNANHEIQVALLDMALESKVQELEQEPAPEPIHNNDEYFSVFKRKPGRPRKYI
jgi:hypothetical protein